MEKIGERQRRLTDMARRFCRLIESCQQDERIDFAAFSAKLSQLLPRLNAELAALGEIDSAANPADDGDLDRRFELYSLLRRALGENDAYWLEFDVARDGQEKSGSLADDLTDIYWELKAGLQHLQQDAGGWLALQHWGAGYRWHWGQHLLDAQRHLYALRARRVG